eukprot:TRINITY_DN24884_c0_g1_i1.p1 TRINITY_DN24884_c0_g1~~TRINITY_DN24884_c0_g1_i1.p1  ORF type:complete len:389 (+),score=33.53 TRINITY_DN24884_c0_g1_i1:81-1169(+)
MSHTILLVLSVFSAAFADCFSQTSNVMRGTAFVQEGFRVAGFESGALLSEGTYSVIESPKWVVDSPPTFPIRTNAAVVSFPWAGRTRILMLGGSNETNATSDVFASDDNGLSWKLLTATPGWPARAWHGAAANSTGVVLITGGQVPGGEMFGDMWWSSDGGNTWVKHSDSEYYGMKRDMSVVALSSGNFLLSGGIDDYGYRSSELYVTRDVSGDWEYWSYFEGGFSSHTMLVAPNGSLALLGGMTDSGLLSGVHVSHDEGLSWTSRPVPGREGHVAGMMSTGRIVVAFGYESNVTFLSDTWVSDDLGITWADLDPSDVPLPRAHAGSVVLPGDRFLVVGGVVNGDSGPVPRGEVCELSCMGA